MLPLRSALPCLLSALLGAGAPEAPPPDVPSVAESAIRAHLGFLADDLLEGRGMGQRGGALAVRYLETQLRMLGLKPLPDGTYRQRVDIQGVRLKPEACTVRFDGCGTAPVQPRDLVLSAGRAVAREVLEAPVVFVGYGIDAPEEHWNDYQGLDCRGRLLVMLAGEPPPTAAEPDRFEGGNLTRHGRWDHKFTEAARHGAAGVLLIHTTEAASYGWDVVQASFSGEQFHLAEDTLLNAFQGWITDAYARTLFRACGQDLDGLRAAAQARTFRAVSLELRLQARLDGEARTFSEYNVLGLLPGSDPALKEEAVVFSAHWDHFGIQDGKTFNGAVDNGSALASLLALAQATRPARRTQVFLFTCGEESGLLGSRAYTRHPAFPLAKTAACVNLESLNWVGPSRDIEFLGGERSTLLELGRDVATRLGMALRTSDPDPAGLYLRSDHYPFVEAGIPALSPGFSLAGHRNYLESPDASRAKGLTYLQRYHTPEDRYDPAWDMRGMVQQARFILGLGLAVADADGRPRFLKR